MNSFFQSIFLLLLLFPCYFHYIHNILVVFNNISFQTNEKEEKYLLLAPFFRFSHTLLFSFQIHSSKKNI